MPPPARRVPSEPRRREQRGRRAGVRRRSESRVAGDVDGEQTRRPGGAVVSYSQVLSAASNWHLFETIDILKHGSGTEEHFSTASLNTTPPLRAQYCGEQLAVPGVPRPVAVSDLVTWGVVEGTRIGYVYVTAWTGDAGERPEQAIRELTMERATDGLIIDFRVNRGGNMFLSDGGLGMLFDRPMPTIGFAYGPTRTTITKCGWRSAETATRSRSAALRGCGPRSKRLPAHDRRSRRSCICRRAAAMPPLPPSTEAGPPWARIARRRARGLRPQRASVVGCGRAPIPRQAKGRGSPTAGTGACRGLLAEQLCGAGARAASP